MSFAGLFRALVIVSVLSGCATTEITSTWRAPDAKPVVQGSKVVTLVLMASPGQRRAAEDELARNVKNATPAYKALKDEEITNKEVLRAKLAEQGFVYCVVMEIQGILIEEQAAVTPTVHRTNLWDSGAIMYSEPRYTNTKVFVATRLYSVADGNLIWEAQSKTFNPENAGDLVDDIAKAARARLQKDGLIAAQ